MFLITFSRLLLSISTVTPSLPYRNLTSSLQDIKEEELDMHPDEMAAMLNGGGGGGRGMHEVR